MHWLVFTLLSLSFFTIFNVLSKVLIDESGEPRVFAFLFCLFASVINALIVVTTQMQYVKIPHAKIAYIFVLLAIVFFGIFERIRFNALELINVSVFSVIFNFSLLVTYFGSLFLYHENVTMWRTLGMLLIFSSLILVSYQSGRKKLMMKGILLSIATAITYGLGSMLDKAGSRFFSPAMYSLLLWTGVLPVIFLFPSIDLEKIRTKIKSFGWKIAVLSFLNVLAYFMQLKALEVADATSVIPIVQTSVIFTTLLGIFYLKEKEGMIRKVIASFLTVIGALLILR